MKNCHIQCLRSGFLINQRWQHPACHLYRLSTRVRDLPLGINQDGAFLPSQSSSKPHSFKILVDAKAMEQKHVLKVWLGVSMGMSPVKCNALTKPPFVSVKFYGKHKAVTRMRLIWPSSVMGILPDVKQLCLLPVRGLNGVFSNFINLHF